MAVKDPVIDMADLTQRQEPIYTPKEVAHMLRVSQRTVQSWIQSGALSAVQYGKLLRIRQADINAFGKVLNQRPPAAETE